MQKKINKKDGKKRELNLITSVIFVCVCVFENVTWLRQPADWDWILNSLFYRRRALHWFPRPWEAHLQMAKCLIIYHLKIDASYDSFSSFSPSLPFISLVSCVCVFVCGFVRLLKPHATNKCLIIILRSYSLLLCIVVGWFVRLN